MLADIHMVPLFERGEGLPKRAKEERKGKRGKEENQVNIYLVGCRTVRLSEPLNGSKLKSNIAKRCKHGEAANAIPMRLEPLSKRLCQVIEILMTKFLRANARFGVLRHVNGTRSVKL